jgi:hypothetical protein
MAEFLEALERREQQRTRQEFPCVLLAEGCRYRGLVQDVSARGLFVQTPGDLPPGVNAIVTFRTPEGRRFTLETSVPYRRQLSHSLACLGFGGVGLHIQQPSSAYLRWVEGVRGEER